MRKIRQVRRLDTQEVTDSSSVEPTNKSNTYDGFSGAHNPLLAQLARDFVHLLCTSELHGSITLWPKPRAGRCDVCGAYIGIRPGMPGHIFSNEGGLLRARCASHADTPDEAAMGAVSVRFPAGTPGSH